MLSKALRSSNLERLARSAGAARSLASTTDGTKGSTEFWAQYQLKDLPDSSIDLELLRRHNTSYPFLENHAVVGKIIGVDKDHVTISTGLKSVSSFAKKELHLSQLIRSRDARVRNGPRDFRLGDVMHFLLDELETPFGDVGLKVSKLREEEKTRLLWEELEELHRSNKPVKGRILNPLNRGYVVGIAGITAFLPFSQCSLLTASKVGVLQPFLIRTVEREEHFVTVVDPAMVAQQEARRKEMEERIKMNRQQAASNRANALGQQQAREANMALTHQQLVWIKNRINVWRTETASNGNIRPFPEAMKIVMEVSRKRGYFFLNRKQLEYLITRLESQLPGDIYKSVLTQLGTWGVDTSFRSLPKKAAQSSAEEVQPK